MSIFQLKTWIFTSGCVEKNQKRDFLPESFDSLSIGEQTGRTIKIPNFINNITR